MKSVVVSGATGFIGKELVRSLVERGDRVTALTRDPARARPLVPEGAAIERWDGGSGDAPLSCLEGADAVVHLAGERAVGVYWTDAVKREIEDSRVKSTERLVRAIERSARKPSVFVSASGVGFYGPHGNEALDETAPAGEDYLASVCVAWEGAAARATALGVRVVCARLGIVLGRGGGALSQMALPFKMFVGGPIGSGKQQVSWVHLEDAVRIFERAIDDESLRGPVNVVSPNGVTNAELSAAIGRTLSRPSVFRVPEAALRLRFGEGADPLVTGQRAIPAALVARGHQFRYAELDAALAEALGG
ncbi:MAG TPA: TIGR01777 family oxidoreductase [Polyangiaceae bacterium]|nr:TIGR01777 family oxidoreductase [Polyangiaceae bacterium]